MYINLGSFAKEKGGLMPMKKKQKRQKQNITKIVDLIKKQAEMISDPPDELRRSSLQQRASFFDDELRKLERLFDALGKLSWKKRLDTIDNIDADVFSKDAFLDRCDKLFGTAKMGDELEDEDAYIIAPTPIMSTIVGC